MEFFLFVSFWLENETLKNEKWKVESRKWKIIMENVGEKLILNRTFFS
jgi:hypothetical protein